MKKFVGIFQKLFMSSLGSIIAANAGANSDNISKRQLFNYLEDDNSPNINTDFKFDLSPKLLLKFNAAGDEWSVDAHRSHRSHSSHQSHRSHYSSTGGHVSHFSHYSSSTGGTQQPNTGTTKSPTSTPTKKSYKLGDRTIYKDMKGMDVTEAVNCLLKKKYLVLKDGSTTAYGEYTYDNVVYEAIKQFQMDNGIKADGIIGPTTVFYLKK
jgi:hypothetical protein